MNKKNKRRITALAISFICLASCAHSAFAESLTVKVAQVNPASGTQQVTCTYRQKCSLQLPINKGQADAQTLDVRIQYLPSKMIFQFEGKDGFFYAADQDVKDGVYSVFWPQNTPDDKPSATYHVTLFGPAVLHPETSLMLRMADEAARQAEHAPIATLEITATSVP
jgi:hypothetical protein